MISSSPTSASPRLPARPWPHTLPSEGPRTPPLSPASHPRPLPPPAAVPASSAPARAPSARAGTRAVLSGAPGRLSPQRAEDGAEGSALRLHASPGRGGASELLFLSRSPCPGGGTRREGTPSHAHTPRAPGPRPHAQRPEPEPRRGPWRRPHPPRPPDSSRGHAVLVGCFLCQMTCRHIRVGNLPPPPRPGEAFIQFDQRARDLEIPAPPSQAA